MPGSRARPQRIQNGTRTGPGQLGRISRHPAHPALVSEADFLAAQDATAPRGPADPATRRYLLAGLLACGRCGQRLESAWYNGKPVYRCRHGHTSAARPDPGRPKNTHVREDQILPHLATLAILLSSDHQALPDGTMQVTAPGEAAGLIDHLRTAGITLTYDPDTRTIRTGDSDSVAVTVGQDRLHHRNNRPGKEEEKYLEHPPEPGAEPG
jgi:site-specific DNA recombinase